MGIVLVASFFIFAFNIGALAAFGRYALSWRKLGILALGACVPAVGMFGAMGLSGVQEMMELPAVLACAMAFIGWLCVLVLGRLETWGKAKPDSLQERLGVAKSRSESQGE